MSQAASLTVASGVSDVEAQARNDLAALYRLCVNYGWTDLTVTHISARLSDQPDHYLLNTPDMLFDEICASNLSKFTFDGELVGEPRHTNLAGHIIHSNVLNARPEINFVMHTHTRAGTAVSATPGGLRPLTQHAAIVLGTLSTHPYLDSTAVADEGQILAHDLGNNHAMLLENHGILTVGRTAAEAFFYHYYVEMACKMQVDILSCTDAPIEITAEAAAPLMAWGSPDNGPHGEREWPALMRMLDRKHPGYRD